jgi:pimeloyl-ACP methyl ester carboxylesterase
MKVAEATELSALVLVAAVSPAQIQAAPPRPFRLLRLKYSPLVFLGRPFRPQDKDFAKNWLSSVPEKRRPAILKGMVPESSGLVKEYFYRRVKIETARIRCPVLVIGGNQDQLVSSTALHELASALGAQLLEYPNHGHWMMGEADGQKIVRDIHRWVIQKLGEKILLPELLQNPSF